MSEKKTRKYLKLADLPLGAQFWFAAKNEADPTLCEIISMLSMRRDDDPDRGDGKVMAVFELLNTLIPVPLHRCFLSFDEARDFLIEELQQHHRDVSSTIDELQEAEPPRRLCAHAL